MEELQADVSELQQLLDGATRKRVQDILTVEIRKIQTEISHRHAGEDGGGDASTEIQQKPEKVTAVKNTRYCKTLTTYAWDQSEKFMKIYVTLKGVQQLDKESITSTYSDRSVKLRVSNLEGKDYQLYISNLFEIINVDSSYHKVKTDTVLLMLKKKEEKKTWAYVTLKDKKEKEKAKPDMAKDGDGDKDPNGALMDMMKKMYDDGDDEMKRTIGKAWSESRNKNPEMGGMM